MVAATPAQSSLFQCLPSAVERSRYDYTAFPHAPRCGGAFEASYLCETLLLRDDHHSCCAEHLFVVVAFRGVGGNVRVRTGERYWKNE